MRKIWITGIVLIISLAVFLVLPKRIEVIFGHSFQKISRGSITIIRDDLDTKYFEIETRNLDKLILCFESLRIKPVKKADYIPHKKGFGFYHVVFTDDQSRVIEPTFQIDYDGNMYINNIQYQVEGSDDLILLLELISEPRIPKGIV